MSPPVFPSDEDKTRKARVLHTLTITLLVVVLLGFVGVAVVFVDKRLTFFMATVMFAMFVTIYFLTKRGHIELGGISYVFLLWGGATAVLYVGSVTNSTGAYLYIAVAVTAGILLGIRWAVVVSVLSSAALLAFAVLQTRGIEFPRYLPEPPLARWFNFSVILFLTIAPVHLTLDSLSRALSRARKVNEQRKQTERLLRESERKFHDIANNVPGIIFQLRAPTEGTPYFSYVNPQGLAALELAGVTGSGGLELGARVHPDDKAAFDTSVEEAVAKRATWRFDGRMLNNQNRVIWVQGIASPTATEDGLTFDGILLDVTLRKRLEERLSQSQKLAAVGRLSGGIAHDFNNILIPIIGYVELAMKKATSDEGIYRDLTRVREAADRAASLTHQILAFSRNQVIERQLLDLNVVVADFQAMAQRLIGEHIQFDTRLAPGPVELMGDRGQIEQLLMNLTVNARDAMPGGGNLTVRTSTIHLDEAAAHRFADDLPAGDYAVLSIDDSGQGMSAEVQQQIFEPFFTTKQPGKGTGLGLATVYGIVRHSGGHIEVESQPGRGTSFSVYLPVAGVQGATGGSTQGSTPEGEGGNETVLVVEDDSEVRRLTVRVLEERGYRVLHASNGHEALEKFGEAGTQIDLMLTDMVMPGMSGAELASRMRSLRSGLRLVFMSGYTDNPLAPKMEREGLFMQKPFTVEELAAKVRQALDQKRDSTNESADRCD